MSECFVFCRRIREKYESEVRELERSERQAVERYNEIKVSFILNLEWFSNFWHFLYFKKVLRIYYLNYKNKFDSIPNNSIFVCLCANWTCSSTINGLQDWFVYYCSMVKYFIIDIYLNHNWEKNWFPYHQWDSWYMKCIKNVSMQSSWHSNIVLPKRYLL